MKMTDFYTPKVLDLTKQYLEQMKDFEEAEKKQDEEEKERIRSLSREELEEYAFELYKENKWKL